MVALTSTGAPLDRSDSALLETLLLEAPVAFAFYDVELRYRRINSALAEINGRSIEEHLGRRPREVLQPALGAAVEANLQRVLDTGAVILDPDFTAESVDGAGLRHYQSSWYPARGADGETVGVAVLVVDVTERRRVEEQLRLSQQRTASLLAATSRLSGALTVDEVVAIIVETGRVTVGADSSSVVLVEDGTLRFAPSGAEATDAQRTLQANVSFPTPSGEVVRSGRPAYLPCRDGLLRWMPHQHIRDFLATSQEQSWAILPLTSSGSGLGVLRFAFHGQRTLAEDERVFLEALAGQCALALERARLYEREHRLAAALQRSLLPERLPEQPGVELAARYLPGTDESEVGGDWYDAFPLPDGRLALVVGDVMGKGLSAAAGMGRMRTAVRALTFVHADPATVIQGLDRLFTATEPEDSLTTLFLGLLDPRTGGLVMSDAGHPGVVVLHPDGTTTELVASPEATPLGLPEVRTQSSCFLREGDLLVAFTDGLVEHRLRSVDEGMAELSTCLRGQLGAGPEQVVEAVLTSLLEPDRRRDDVTVLVVRLTGGAA